MSGNRAARTLRWAVKHPGGYMTSRITSLAFGVGVLLFTTAVEAQVETVVVTGSFIPIEIYELVKDFGVGKVVALIVNVAIVIYLAWRRLEERKGAFNKIRHALGAS